MLSAVCSSHIGAGLSSPPRAPADTSWGLSLHVLRPRAADVYVNILLEALYLADLLPREPIKTSGLSYCPLTPAARSSLTAFDPTNLQHPNSSPHYCTWTQTHTCSQYSASLWMLKIASTGRLVILIFRLYSSIRSGYGAKVYIALDIACSSFGKSFIHERLEHSSTKAIAFLSSSLLMQRMRSVDHFTSGKSVA